jgi:hypothetical protein
MVDMRLNKMNTLVIALLIVAFIMLLGGCGGDETSGEVKLASDSPKPAGSDAGKVSDDKDPADKPSEAETKSAEDPYKRYQAAVDAVMNGDSISFDISSEMKISDDKEEVALTGNGFLKVVDMQARQPQAEISYKLGAEGQDLIDLHYFDKDGYAYVEMLGVKVKTPLDEAVDVDVAMSQVGKKFQEVSFEFITDVSESKSGGVTEYTFRLKEGASYLIEEFTNIYAKYSDIKVEDTEIRELSVIAEIDDTGKLVSQTIRMDLAVAAEGEGARMNVTERYDNFKTKNVTIKVPSDIDSYEEVPSVLGDLVTDGA